MKAKKTILAIFYAAAMYALPLLADAPIKGSIIADETRKSEWPSLAKITLEEATAIALRRHGGGTVLEAKLEEEDGFLVYSVEIRSSKYVKRDLLIDAGDGSVLEDDLDD